VPVLFGVNNKKNKMFKRYEKNELGRDFVVGDIHGCFTLLEKHLKALSKPTVFLVSVIWLIVGQKVPACWSF
jgi:hypothetical protein